MNGMLLLLKLLMYWFLFFADQIPSRQSFAHDNVPSFFSTQNMQSNLQATYVVCICPTVCLKLVFEIFYVFKPIVAYWG